MARRPPFFIDYGPPSPNSRGMSHRLVMETIMHELQHSLRQQRPGFNVAADIAINSDLTDPRAGTIETEGVLISDEVEPPGR